MPAFDADEVYKNVAKRTMLVVCLLLLVYLSAGPLSLIFFECVQEPGRRDHGIGSVEQFCEMYRPFFMLEVVTSPTAAQVIAFGFLLGSGLFALGYKKKDTVTRELSIIILAFSFVLSVYSYHSLRTLRISQFAQQKEQGLLNGLSFRLKCPWRGLECFSN